MKSGQRVYGRHAGTLPEGPDVGTLTGEYSGTFEDRIVYYTYRMPINGQMSVYRHLVNTNGMVDKDTQFIKPCINLIVYEFGTMGVLSILRKLTGPLRWSK